MKARQIIGISILTPLLIASVGYTACHRNKIQKEHTTVEAADKNKVDSALKIQSDTATTNAIFELSHKKYFK